MMPSSMPQGAPATAASDTEQKRMDACVEDLSRRVNDVRTAIATLATKLETEPHLNWSSFLDSIAIVTAQVIKNFQHSIFMRVDFAVRLLGRIA